MRMWGVNPRYLCRKHLLGEHLELHYFLVNLKNGKSIKGFINKGLVEVHNINKRHSELVKEMINRGYNHKSSLVITDGLLYTAGLLNIEVNILELKRRCTECKKRIESNEC